MSFTQSMLGNRPLLVLSLVGSGSAIIHLLLVCLCVCDFPLVLFCFVVVVFRLERLLNSKEGLSKPQVLPRPYLDLKRHSEFSDLTLVSVEGKSLHCHKCVMVARSGEYVHVCFCEPFFFKFGSFYFFFFQNISEACY